MLWRAESREEKEGAGLCCCGLLTVMDAETRSEGVCSFLSFCVLTVSLCAPFLQKSVRCASLPRPPMMRASCAALLAVVAVLALLASPVLADLYMQNPRGSNNRLNEQTATRDNNNRMFDSQVRAHSQRKHAEAEWWA